MSLTKFYHYTIWIEDDDGTRVNPQNTLTEEGFDDSIYDIEEDGDKHYSTQFQFIRNWEYYGVLIRTKDDEGYVRRGEDGVITSLSEVTEDEGETADREFDYVDYALKVGTGSIDLLLKVGFQTPGIGMIKKYLEDHIDGKGNANLEIVYETKMVSDSEERLDRILDTDLKSVDISLKKHPREFDDLDLEETLEELTPDDYRLEFSVSLRSGKGRKKKSVKSVLGRIFNRDENEVRNTIAQIDLPRVMYSFNIVGFEDGDREKEVEENLTDTVLKEEIDTVRYGIFDENLGEVLCRRIRKLE